MKLRLDAGVTLLFVLLAPLAIRAELSSKEHVTAQSMIVGTLYLRLDVPCRYGRGRWGIAKAIHHVESLLEVSPEGYSVEHKLALPPKHKGDSVYWGFSPNDAVRYGKLLFDGDTVQVWMEGVSPNDYEMILDFIHIQNLADFTKAFNLAFSRVPLQDEHPEWPPEVQKAIVEHRVIVGMTEEQAFSVVGSSISVVTSQESGVKTDTWLPRQNRGFVTSWGQVEGTRTGFPSLLRFTGGRLQVIEQAPVIPGLSGK
jgi:hypothetical protein